VLAMSVSTVMMSSKSRDDAVAGPASRCLNRVVESYRNARPFDQ
jgi:hypothetical protein